MKTYSSLLALIVGLTLLGRLSPAADMDATKETAPWLSQEQVQVLINSVPPPPTDDSADLATILKSQASRTDAMIQEADRDQKFAYTLFQSVYGSNLTPDNSPKFFELMKKVLRVTKAINEADKAKFKRLRPYKGHPDQVKALFQVDGFSYPSGHAMGSYTLATVLGAVFPDKAAAFLDRAAQIAQSRVDAGVHYPSDIAEGQVLGKATGEAILSNGAFQKDLAEVQAELKKARD